MYKEEKIQINYKEKDRYQAGYSQIKSNQISFPTDKTQNIFILDVCKRECLQKAFRKRLERLVLAVLTFVSVDDLLDNTRYDYSKDEETAQNYQGPLLITQMMPNVHLPKHDPSLVHF